MDELTQAVRRRLSEAAGLWLFLDYDGTLADFAPTPDDIYPDETLIGLLRKLAKLPGLRVAVVSGRRLSHIQALVPVPGILLAGTYGVEMQLPEGEEVFQLEYEALRPVLEGLKPRWQALIDGRDDFYLEDKGWALALHARYASEEEAEEVLRTAERILSQEAPENFRVLGGHKFLEIGPQAAHKGKTVQRLLEQYPWPGALLVYFGDDDKDEEAFEVIQSNQGLAVVVASQPRLTRADFRLESPVQVRRWLEDLILTQI